MGLFGKIFKGVGKVAGGVIKNVARPVLRATPAGRAISMAGRAVGGIRKVLGSRAGKRARRALVRAGGAAATGAAFTGGGLAVERLGQRGRPGMSGLEEFSGGRGSSLRGGGGGIRYRRINPANVKALRRAIRRVDRFKKLARAVGFSRAPAKIRHVRKVKGM